MSAQLPSATAPQALFTTTPPVLSSTASLFSSAPTSPSTTTPQLALATPQLASPATPPVPAVASLQLPSATTVQDLERSPYSNNSASPKSPESVYSSAKSVSDAPKYIGSCSPAELVNWAARSDTNEFVKGLAKTVLVHIITTFADKVSTSIQDYADVTPLAAYPDEEVRNQLLTSILQKEREAAVVNLDKLVYVSTMIEKAGAVVDAEKDDLFYPTVYSVIATVANQISKLNVNSSLLIPSLRELLTILCVAQSVRVCEKATEAVLTAVGCLKDSFTRVNDLTAPSRITLQFYLDAIDQAHSRVTVVPTDQELIVQGVSNFVLGTLTTSIGAMCHDVSTIPNAARILHTSVLNVCRGLGGTLKPWFILVYTMHLLFRQCIPVFFSYLSCFSSDDLSFEVIVSCLLLFDVLIRDRESREVSDVGADGIMSAKLAALKWTRELLLSLGTLSKLENGQREQIEILVLNNISLYCQIPEQEVQRVAKLVACEILKADQAARADTNAMMGSVFQWPRTVVPRAADYWPSEAFILNEVTDTNFSYGAVVVFPRPGLVEDAFRISLPIDSLLETMHAQVAEASSSVETYIDIMGIRNKDRQPLTKIVRRFLRDRKQRLLLIHGSAGTGKSLFARHLQSLAWKDYFGTRTYVPVIINLAAIRNPSHAAIKQHLSEQGFTELQIKKLQSRKVLFILDGFDEIQMQENLYATNRFSDWDCVKVVVTARTEYLRSLGLYSRYFQVATQAELAECYICPFDPFLRNEFLSTMVARKFCDQKTKELVLQALEGSPLSEIATTPFMLRILVNVVPYLSSEGKTLTDIYEAFVEQEFEQSKVKVNDSVKPKDFDPVESFWKYSMNLAVNMFARCVTSVTTYGGNYRFDHELDYFWDKFFNDKSLSVSAARHGAPLIKIGRQIQFRHKSLQDFFAARMLVQEIRNLIGFGIDVKNTDYFNLRSISAEPSVLAFMTEMLLRSSNPLLVGPLNSHEYEVLIKLLNNAAEAKSAELAVAVGNALTLLVSCKVSFAGVKLNGLVCEGAKMDGGCFVGAEFKSASFIRCSWDGSDISRARFHNTTFVDNRIIERAELCLTAGWRMGQLHVLAAPKAILVGGVIFRDGRPSYLGMTMSEDGMIDFIAKSPSGQFVVCATRELCYLLSIGDDKVLHSWIPSGEFRVAALTDERCLFIEQNQLKICEFAAVSVGTSPVAPRSISDILTHLFIADIYQVEVISATEALCYRLQNLTGNHRLAIICKIRFKADIPLVSPVTVTFTPCDKNNQVFTRLNYYTADSPSTHVLVMEAKDNNLRCFDDELRELSVRCENTFSSIDGLCVSHTGRYLLMKKGQDVRVFRVTIQRRQLKLEYLYCQYGIHNFVDMQQFTADDMFIAWGQLGQVTVTKAADNVVVQAANLRYPQAEPVQVAVAAIGSYGAESQLLIVENVDLQTITRVRLTIDEQPASGTVRVYPNYKINAFRAEFIGASFQTKLGLPAKDDRLLFKEHGGIFKTVEEVVLKYKGGNDSDKLSAAFRLLRYGYEVSFPALDISAATYESLAYLILMDQRNDGEYDHVLPLLLSKIDSINRLVTETDRTLLHIAAGKGHLRTCRLLLENGADINALTSKGMTPLCLAVLCNSREVCELLLNKKADVNLGGNTLTPLYVAIHGGSAEICELLLEYTAQVEMSYILPAAARQLCRMCDRILQITGSVDFREPGTLQTALIKAAYQGHADVCELLLSKGADMRIFDVHGWTPLMHAAFDGHESVCALLLQKGADVNQTFSDTTIATDRVIKRTALALAASEGHLSVCTVLLGRTNALVDPEDVNGTTPLARAAARGNIAVCALLLRCGAAVEHRESNNWTPLMHAAYGNHPNVCKLLLTAGADKSSRSELGRSALMYAASGGHREVCELLLGHNNVRNDNDVRDVFNGDLLMQEDARGLTAIHFAAWNRQLDCLKLLVQFPSPLAEIGEKISPLQLAVIDGGDVDIIDYLVQNGANLDRELDGLTVGTLAEIRGLSAQIEYFAERGKTYSTEELATCGCNVFLLLDAAWKTILVNMGRLGKNFSEPDSRGQTWLHLAAIGLKNADIVRCLLLLGADPSVEYNLGLWRGTVRDAALAEEPSLPHVVSELENFNL
jgi:ankyrin repeat protein